MPRKLCEKIPDYILCKRNKFNHVLYVQELEYVILKIDTIIFLAKKQSLIIVWKYQTNLY